MFVFSVHRGAACRHQPGAICNQGGGEFGAHQRSQVGQGDAPYRVGRVEYQKRFRTPWELTQEPSPGRAYSQVHLPYPTAQLSTMCTASGSAIGSCAIQLCNRAVAPGAVRSKPEPWPEQCAVSLQPSAHKSYLHCSTRSPHSVHILRHIIRFKANCQCRDAGLGTPQARAARGLSSQNTHLPPYAPARTDCGRHGRC